MTDLKQMREELGLTQRQAAELVGVQANTWARWERGELVPRGAALRLIELLPLIRRQAKKAG
jgi:DNA-binding transcriptional regulator YiaG